MKKSKQQIEAEDKEFQRLYKTFLVLRDKDIWDRMFQLVHEACESAIKKKCVGISVPDFDGKVLEATMDVMKRLAKDVKANKINIPNKLATLVYSYSLFPLYSPATKFFERQVSYEQVLETYGEQEYEENIGEEDNE